MPRLVLFLAVLAACLDYAVPLYLARYRYGSGTHRPEECSVRFQEGTQGRYGATWLARHRKSDRRMTVQWTI